MPASAISVRMRYYPAFIDLRGKRCLVVGLGGVGLRKLASLAECEPLDILALDPYLGPAPREGSALEPPWDLLLRPGVSFMARPFEERDLEGMFLAIAASADQELNRRIGELCRERNILCNIADAPELGDFIVPSRVDIGELSLAVSTGGHSPALARRVKRDLLECLGSRYEPLLALMRRLRPRVLSLGRPTRENTALFRALVDSDLAERLEAGDEESARQTLERLLPFALHPTIGELLHGLV